MKPPRKVALIKHKDEYRDRLTLTHIVEKSKISLKITIQSETRHVKRRNSDNEKREYYNFRPKKDRIVPCCFRDKCKRDIRHKTKHCRRKHKKPGKKEGRDKKERKRTPSIISLSDEENVSFDDISSGSLSSYSDNEIETLLLSTRKRMKESDEEWKFLPKPSKLTSKSSSQIIVYDRSTRSPSLHSIDTLIIDDKKNVLTPPKLVSLHSPIKWPQETPQLVSNHSGVKRKLNYDPIETSKCKEYFEKNEYEQFNKTIKLERLEINDKKDNSTPFNRSNLYSKNSHKNAEDSYNAHYSKEADTKNIIKTEPSETISLTNCEKKYIAAPVQNSCEKDKIETKLESWIDHSSELNFKYLIDVKQELYGDI